MHLAIAGKKSSPQFSGSCDKSNREIQPLLQEPDLSSLNQTNAPESGNPLLLKRNETDVSPAAAVIPSNDQTNLSHTSTSEHTPSTN